jgi:hypothetical protein
MFGWMAAGLILRLLDDAELPERCARAAFERVGPAGGSRRIAETVLDTLGQGRSALS